MTGLFLGSRGGMNVENTTRTRRRTHPLSADLLARLIRVDEALEDGDYPFARSIVHDLLGELEPRRQPGKVACPCCALRLWPGELDKHLSVSHWTSSAELADEARAA
jgi:hypothetical protein